PFSRLGSVAAVALALCLGAFADETPRITHGPFLGHAAPTVAVVWARFAQAGSYTLTLANGVTGDPVGEPLAVAADETTDHCVVWQVAALTPRTSYTYSISGDAGSIVAGHELRTAPRHDTDARVVLAVGSCASDSRFPAQPIWTRIVDDGADAVVLLGDTPYIDSTDLAVQRRRYGEFFNVPELRSAMARVPFYATWDDHDFGRNDTDGQLDGKENSRRAFEEYHANPTYGTGREGIYTSFRRGSVEVFLLDTRWFACTEPSPVDPDKPTLLGREQWDWLRESLAASTAPFKVLACGMVWNGAVRPNKPDHWMSYPHEREALFRYIGDAGVTGVLLVGGDIHRTRSLRYPTRDLAGYDIIELITSPLANTIIEAANAPSPYLLFDVGDQQTYLRLAADRESLTAEFRSVAGVTHYAVILTTAELRASR
ncbi:MAG: alkaline phosphatase D family protein, partial [Candidatus Poribacteria bacterium]